MQGGIECCLDGTGACPSFVASSSMCDACDSLSISRSIHLSLYAQMRRSLPPSQCKHMLCRNPIGSPFIGPQCHSCLGKQGFAIQKSPFLNDQLGVVATRCHRNGTVLGQYRGTKQLVGDKYDYAIVANGIVVDAFDPHQSNWVRYCNHAAHGSRHCNSELVRRGERFLLMATCEIQTGEEVMFDYGDDYWCNREPPVSKCESRASMCTRFITIVRKFMAGRNVI